MPAERCCLLEKPPSRHEGASLPPCAGLAADPPSPVLAGSCLLVVPHHQDSLPRNTPLEFYPIHPSSSLENRSAISSQVFVLVLSSFVSTVPPPAWCMDCPVHS